LCDKPTDRNWSALHTGQEFIRNSIDLSVCGPNEQG
jgi:hypothetical protein